MAKSIITSHRRVAIPDPPPTFHDDNDALAWSVRIGAYQNTHQARQDFATIAQRGRHRWAYWIGLVINRVSQ